MTDKVDHRAFFEKYKGVTYLGERGKLRMMADSEPTEEERYQATKARLLAEVRVDITSVPLMTEHGDRVEQMCHGDRGCLIDGEDL